MNTEGEMGKRLKHSKRSIPLFGVLFICLFTIMISTLVFYSVPAIRYSSIVEPSVKDIDPVVFYEDYKDNKEGYVFLDVRSAEAYNNLHAKGSILQPLHTLYTERLRLPKNDPNKTIVLICSGGVASGVAYSYLEHYGYRNIVRVKGGIENWQTSRLPVEGTLILKQ